MKKNNNEINNLTNNRTKTESINSINALEIQNKKKPKKKMNIALKILLILLVSLIIVVVTTVATIFIYLDNKLGKIQYSALTKSDVYINQQVDEELVTYRNIALFGIDARSDTFSRGNRSDCIMIISINESTNDVKITSVYRDTYLDIEGHNLDKVTHAYSFGEAKLALNTLNKNLDLNISEFVAVNFETVRETVDQVGGIMIEITEEEVPHINGINKAGTYNLNGTQALAYSRIRHASGGDYKRTERMREVLIATFNKVKSLSLSELNRLLDIMLPHIYTNIQKNQIKEVIPKVISYKVVDNFGFPDVDMVDGKMIDGVWYGVPKDLEKSVSKLHNRLFNQKDYIPSDTVKNISTKIIEKAIKKN